MPQDVGDGFGVYALLDRQGCEGVPNAVEGNIFAIPAFLAGFCADVQRGPGL